MKNSSFSSQGQTLVEVIIALAITILVISSLVVGVVVAIKNARFAKNQSLATKFAQEAMEGARLYRDQYGWDQFWTDKVPSTEEGSVGIFTRTVVYENAETALDENDRAQVSVTVSWTVGGRTHKSKLTTYLSKW